MELERLVLGPISTNCYIIYSAGKAAVVDPADSPELILERLAALNLELVHIILTHAHWDHTGGAGPLKKSTGAQVSIGKKELAVLKNPALSLASWYGSGSEPLEPERLLEEGDTLDFGGCSLAVLDTPGHTPGGISLFEGKTLFSGDALFNGSVGRTDFPGSDHGALIEAIRTRILSLEDDVRVYPGHGEDTTVGRERSSNPFLAR